MSGTPERKLTTIFSADAAGYSRFMGEDERAALAALRDRRGTMDGLIAGHGGRIVNTAGDAVLAEFASVVKAVECAIAIQREVAERNAPLPPERQMWFRIGINLGDVMVEKGDLFGDGVNVAARLQALCDPGGVLVSGPVHDLVKDKLSVGFDFLGPQSLKNLPNRVPVYRVMLQPGSAPPPRPAAPAASATLRHRLMTAAAVPALLIAALLAINLLSWDGEWWFQWPALAIVFVAGLRVIRAWQRHVR